MWSVASRVCIRARYCSSCLMSFFCGVCAGAGEGGVLRGAVFSRERANDPRTRSTLSSAAPRRVWYATMSASVPFPERVSDRTSNASSAAAASAAASATPSSKRKMAPWLSSAATCSSVCREGPSGSVSMSNVNPRDGVDTCDSTSATSEPRIAFSTSYAQCAGVRRAKVGSRKMRRCAAGSSANCKDAGDPSRSGSRPVDKRGSGNVEVAILLGVLKFAREISTTRGVLRTTHWSLLLVVLIVVVLLGGP